MSQVFGKIDSDARELQRIARPGMTFYSLKREYGDLVCDSWPVTTVGLFGPMVGSSSLADILFSYGPLYAEPITEYSGQPVRFNG